MCRSGRKMLGSPSPNPLTVRSSPPSSCINVVDFARRVVIFVTLKWRVAADGRRMVLHINVTPFGRDVSTRGRKTRDHRHDLTALMKRDRTTVGRSAAVKSTLFVIIIVTFLVNEFEALSFRPSLRPLPPHESIVPVASSAAAIDFTGHR